MGHEVKKRAADPRSKVASRAQVYWQLQCELLRVRTLRSLRRADSE